MSLERKLEGLESELKLVKGEIKQTLIDLRDHLAQREAPFANLKVARLSPEGQAARPVHAAPPEPEAAEAEEVEAPVRPHVREVPATAPHPAPAAEAAQPQPMAPAAAPQGAQPTFPQGAPPMAPQGYPAPVVATQWVTPPAPAYPQPMPQAQPAAQEPTPPNSPWRGAVLAFAPSRRGAPEPQQAAPAQPHAVDPAAYPGYGVAPVPVAPGQPDVHQVAAIIKWLAWTKDLLGSEGPDRLLELYSLSFQVAPQVREMIRQASALVPDPQQPPAVTTAEDSIALLLELHGILTGGGALMLLLHAMPQRGV